MDQKCSTRSVDDHLLQWGKLLTSPTSLDHFMKPPLPTFAVLPSNSLPSLRENAQKNCTSALHHGQNGLLRTTTLTGRQPRFLLMGSFVVHPLHAQKQRIRARFGCQMKSDGRDNSDKSINQQQNDGDVLNDFLLDDDLGDSSTGSFSNSRVEWSTPNDKSQTKNDNLASEIEVSGDKESDSLDPTSASSDSPPQPTGSYSFSFKKSRRKNVKLSSPAPSESTQTENSSANEEDIQSFSFSHMRAEFMSDSPSSTSSSSTPSSTENIELDWYNEEPVPDSSATPATSDDIINQNTRQSVIVRKPKRAEKKPRARAKGPVSSGELARRILKVPFLLVRNVLAPAADVISVGWHDLRVNVEDFVDQKHDSAVLAEDELDEEDLAEDARWERDMLAFRDDWRWAQREVGEEEMPQQEEEEGEDEQPLSEEELQILRVQQVAQTMKDGIASQLGKFMNWT